MNYKEFLSDRPIESQEYPYNSIEFFDQEKIINKLYVDKRKMKSNAEDQLEEAVDSYLNDHPEVKRAVAYREEAPEKRFAFREFGKD
ncbi:hypothetical protein [Catalinimonas niigatensis]|uniref:hypothetical protein n=1 Tax=Catalinimonas niigatensis TaxID=1397264 RepID=UPI002665C4B3|nr:hypothetical protein [Catalinimonas niigatensis]WPP52666.1 hypothetical protein PZB72_09765 [Catalinimonas niigatensis]